MAKIITIENEAVKLWPREAQKYHRYTVNRRGELIWIIYAASMDQAAEQAIEKIISRGGLSLAGYTITMI